MTRPRERNTSSRKLYSCVRGLTIFVPIFLSRIFVVPLDAQNLFNDNFETAVSVSPYTMAQPQGNNSLAADSDPGSALAGTWFTPILDVGSADFTLEAWLNARTIPGGISTIAGKRISGLFGDKGIPTKTVEPCH